MLIEIHMIQNHSPANLNRDDLGAPKTCYFGGVLRSRISSQCIKRSIRLSEEFKLLCGGIRTRQLAKLISERTEGKAAAKKRVTKILKECGIASKKDDITDMPIYTTEAAIQEMTALLKDHDGKTDKELADEFGHLIVKSTAVPDMALSGRMLETGKLKDTKVEAALQVAHAMSTHSARPEVDYFITADDIPGDDEGAAHIGEAMFNSACFYKYFSIDWEQLKKNLMGFSGNVEYLAAHTVGAFIRGASIANPSGKQNSYAAQNRPSGILVEFKHSPVSYANAFADPVKNDERDLISQSIAQLATHINDLDVGYGKPEKRFWFSPNLQYPLEVTENVEKEGRKDKVKENRNLSAKDCNFKSLDELVPAVISELGFDWEEVKGVVLNDETKL